MGGRYGGNIGQGRSHTPWRPPRVHCPTPRLRPEKTAPAEPTNSTRIDWGAIGAASAYLLAAVLTGLLL